VIVGSPAAQEDSMDRRTMMIGTTFAALFAAARALPLGIDSSKLLNAAQAHRHAHPRRIRHVSTIRRILMFQPNTLL
jgi:hypothetical protein